MRTRALIVLALAALGMFAACTIPYRGGARVVQPAQLDNTWLRAAPTPVVVQRHMKDCGLAALAMMGGAWGHPWTVDELSRDLPPTEHGLKLASLRDLARKRGLDAYAIAATRKDIENELRQGRPILLGLMLPHDRKRNRSHFEVAVALDPRNGTVVTIDPATGEWMKRAPEILDVEWKAASYAALVVVGDRSATSVGASR